MGENDKPGGGVREINFVSIGRLAEATGISPDRLRIWERRYGKPVPVRLASGHRRYPGDEIPRLRRVADLLARGLRPGKLLTLEDAELGALHLELTTVGPAFDELEVWLDWVLHFRGAQLASALSDAARRLPLREFLGERVSPLLAEIGTRWADGRLCVRHEHFATRVVADRLAALRGAFTSPAGAPSVVLATLPGERHGLALEVLSLLAAREGVGHLVLGVDTPLEEISRAAAESGATAVAISISLAPGGPTPLRSLRELRGGLERPIELVAGGAGMLGRGPRGVRILGDLEAFEHWLQVRSAARTKLEESA